MRALYQAPKARDAVRASDVGFTAHWAPPLERRLVCVADLPATMHSGAYSVNNLAAGSSFVDNCATLSRISCLFTQSHRELLTEKVAITVLENTCTESGGSIWQTHHPLSKRPFDNEAVNVALRAFAFIQFGGVVLPLWPPLNCR